MKKLVISIVLLNLLVACASEKPRNRKLQHLRPLRWQRPRPHLLLLRWSRLIR